MLANCRQAPSAAGARNDAAAPTATTATSGSGARGCHQSLPQGRLHGDRVGGGEGGAQVVGEAQASGEGGGGEVVGQAEALGRPAGDGELAALCVGKGESWNVWKKKKRLVIY